MLPFILPAITALSPLYLPPPSQFEPNSISRIYPSKTKSNLGGGSVSCFLTEIIVDSKKFVVRVDTGSSDTVLPHSTFPNYQGPTVTYNFPSNPKSVYNTYGNHNSWSGFVARMQISLADMTGVAPLVLMTDQSTNPVFESGQNGISGLLGLGFPSLASTSDDPKTLIQSWFDNGVMGKNEVAIHGCHYDKANSSWIDLGNTTPYSDCGNYSVAIGIPYPNHYNLDILGIYVDSKGVDLGVKFQTSGLKDAYSILDSCTSVVVIPEAVYSTIIPKVINGISSKIVNSVNLNDWFIRAGSLNALESDFNWDILPTLGFTIASQDESFRNVTIVLGPRDYIQPDKTGQYWDFLLKNGAELGITFPILGLPLFQAFHITADLKNSQLSFQPGCGCAARKDKYPQMFRDYKGLCAGNCLPPNGDRNSTTCKCEDIVFSGQDVPRRSNGLRVRPNYLHILIWIAFSI